MKCALESRRVCVEVCASINKVSTSVLAFAPELKACPLEGVYAVDAPEDEEESSPLSPGKRSSFVCSEQSVLTSRCQSAEHMQLRSKCSPSSDLTNSKSIIIELKSVKPNVHFR